MPSVLSFNTPASTLVPAQSGTFYNAPFNVDATFAPDQPGGSCAALVYRQYVSGAFTVNGTAFPHYLCQASGILLSGTLQEDGCPPNGSNCTGCTAYGYRQCNMVNTYYNNPDQATGAYFWLYDAPGFSNVTPGSTYEIGLTFRGVILDNATIVADETWQVIGTTTIPGTSVTTASTTCAYDETPLGLHLRQDAEGSSKIILAVARKAGAPAIATGAIELQLIDAAGQKIDPGPAEAHEISNARKAVAYLVYSVPEGATPVKGQIALDGEPWGELPVT